ncbi:MAG: tRNA (adenosine(37)-N6)-dimethylallyltransferase MiaA [Verrucomicrobiales bacterium]
MSGGPICIVGPTGVGKSEVALAVAEAVGGEIVNADAFQLYRGLELLTAAPSAEDRARVPHHLYGELEPRQASDAASFAAMARRTLAALAERAVAAVVVGGSGLYVKALTHGLSDLPSDAGLRQRLAARSLDDKVRELQSLDPAGAATMNLSNQRYVDRALEICLLTGRPASELRSAWRDAGPAHWRGVLLEREREALYARIDRRVVALFDQGVVDEVAAVLATGPAISPTVEKAIGLREIRQVLDGKLTEAAAMEAMQQSTRRYAKRQMTWFRRESWLKTICLSDDATPHSAAAAIVRDYFP